MIASTLAHARERFAAKPPHQRRNWLLGTIMLGSMISLLDATIVNVSIPSIMNDFQESVARVQWVISAYMIAFAVLMPLTGWLIDQVGSRRLYLACLGIFTLGSLLCGLAWNIESLVAFRILQALGGGAMTPIAMGIIAKTFPSREKGRALGIWGAGVLIGPVLGPPLGGVLTEWIGWRAIFLVNLPIGLIGVAAAYLILHRDGKRKVDWSAFDFTGFALFSGFLISLLYGASLVESGGFGGASVFLCAILSMGFFFAFLVTTFRSQRSFLDFSLFRSRVFGISIGISLVRSFALYGGQFLMPLFMTRVQGYREDKVGFMILPGAVLIGALFPFAGRGADRYGSRPFVWIGLSILVFFFGSLSFVTAGTGFWGIELPILIRALGLGLLVTPLNALALGSVPQERSSGASVLLNLSQQVGGSLGIAALGGVLEMRAKWHEGQGLLGMDALAASFQDSFRVGVLVCLLALVLAFALPRTSPEIPSTELDKEVSKDRHGTA